MRVLARLRDLKRPDPPVPADPLERQRERIDRSRRAMLTLLRG